MPYRPIPELAVERRGPVAILTLNNPEMRNAFSDEMQERILAQRIDSRDKLKDKLGETYAPLDPRKLAEGMSLLENAPAESGTFAKPCL